MPRKVIFSVLLSLVVLAFMSRAFTRPPWVVMHAMTMSQADKDILRNASHATITRCERKFGHLPISEWPEYPRKEYLQAREDLDILGGD